MAARIHSGRAALAVPALAALALLAGGPAAEAGGKYGGKPHGKHKRGYVTIVKETVPADSGQRFSFHPSAGLSADDFELGHGERITFRPRAGSHTVEEAEVDGWKLDEIVCDDYDSGGSGRTATIVVDPGEKVVCTFTNSEEQPPPPPPVVPPAPPVVPSPPAAAVAPAPASAVLGTTARRAVGSARLSRPSACVSRTVRVTVTGSPIRRIAFTVDGRLVRTFVTPRRRGPFRVTLPAGRGRLSVVRARVVFANGARARTLRTAVAHCAQGEIQPQFTG